MLPGRTCAGQIPFMKWLWRLTRAQGRKRRDFASSSKRTRRCEMHCNPRRSSGQGKIYSANCRPRLDQPEQVCVSREPADQSVAGGRGAISRAASGAGVYSAIMRNSIRVHKPSRRKRTSLVWGAALPKSARGCDFRRHASWMAAFLCGRLDVHMFERRSACYCPYNFAAMQAFLCKFNQLGKGIP